MSTFTVDNDFLKLVTLTIPQETHRPKNCFWLKSSNIKVLYYLHLAKSIKKVFILTTISLVNNQTREFSCIC